MHLAIDAIDQHVQSCLAEGIELGALVRTDLLIVHHPVNVEAFFRLGTDNIAQVIGCK